MNKKLDKFTKFNKETFNGQGVNWFGKLGIMILDAQTFAEIELSSSVMNEYDSYTVRVVNKLNGVITKHNFPFGEYVAVPDNCSSRLAITDDFHDGLVWGSVFGKLDFTNLRDRIRSFIHLCG